MELIESINQAQKNKGKGRIKDNASSMCEHVLNGDFMPVTCITTRTYLLHKLHQQHRQMMGLQR